MFELEDQRAKSGLISITTYNDIDDHLILHPNRTISSEWVYVDFTQNIMDGLEKWAELAGELNHAVTSDPPATGFYTWYYYRDHVSEKIMIRDSESPCRPRGRKRAVLCV